MYTDSLEDDSLIEEYDDIQVYRSTQYFYREDIKRRYDSHRDLIPEREPEYNSNRYWVHAPIEWLTLAEEDGFAEYYLFDQNKRKKRGLYSMTPKKCAKAWAAIIAETGIRDLHPPARYVPDLVAARGQAYTVTYVYLTNVVPVERVADRFDITKRTAREYIKDVSKRRR